MYALNIKKGTTIQHPEVKLPGLVAVRVSPHIANQLKHIINVVIFDSVLGYDDKPKENNNTRFYGLNKNTLEPLVVK